MSEKIDAARTAIDREVAEDRLKESVVQTLRWSLRTAAITFSGSDIRGLLATARVPFENAAVTSAFKELETAWVQIQARYSELQKDTLAEVRRRASEVIKTSKNPEEVDRLISAVETAQGALQRRFATASGSDPATVLSNTLGALRAIRRLIEAEASGNVRSINIALGSLQNLGSFDREGGIDAELRARAEKAREPYLKNWEAAQTALESALQTGKPIEEVRTLLNALTEASDRVSALRSGWDYGQERDFSGGLGSYRAAVEILGSMEAKDFAGAVQQLRKIREGGNPANDRRSPAVSALLAKWTEEAERLEAKAFQEQVESWRSRLKKVSGPADLDLLIVEVTRAESTRSNQERRSEAPAGLSSSLSTLAAAWRSSNPLLLNDERMQTSGADERQGAFTTEIAELRRRVRREVIAAVLKAPELNQPPLAEKSPEAAISELAKQFAQKKDWRRVLELLEAWQPAPRQGGRAGNELIEAVRSYLAGQNLELAELWSEAAATYKRVLLCTDPLAPVADAAERLKVLKKEHPDEAFAGNGRANGGARIQQ